MELYVQMTEYKYFLQDGNSNKIPYFLIKERIRT